MAEDEKEVNSLMGDKVKCLKKGIEDMSIYACNHCNTYNTRLEWTCIDAPAKEVEVQVFCNSCGNTNILRFKLHSVKVVDMSTHQDVMDEEVVEEPKVCDGCGDALPSTRVCTHRYLESGTQAYERIPFSGFKGDCPVCGCLVGEVHHLDCVLEVCPICKDFLCQCNCYLPEYGMDPDEEE